MYGNGAYTHHCVMALRIEDELFIVESIDARNVSRQTGRFRPQPVNGPDAQRRARKLKAAGVHLQLGSRVIRDVGVHSPQQADVIGHGRHIGKQFGNPQSPVTVL